MTIRVGKFEKISIAQFNKDVKDSKITYNEIPLPVRATKGSAGYDIKTLFDIDLEPGEDIKVPTGLKCKIDNGWGLFALPKSGLGFKYYTRLANTIGLIDEDYYDNKDNEGHMWVKLRNEGKEPLHIDAGKGICQVVFLPYGITYDDEAEGIREGGFGSTNS
jgi:dUTP pyrophosphatase